MSEDEFSGTELSGVGESNIKKRPSFGQMHEVNKKTQTTEP